jgi:hypothetical protein
MKANKAKQDWKFIGSFVGALVVLFTTISGVFKKAGIGFEIIEWLNGEGKDFFIGKLGEITDKFVWRGVRITADDDIIYVDRSKGPTYPTGVTTPEHPDLELAGPPEYNIFQVEIWTPGNQEGIETIKIVDCTFSHSPKDSMVPRIVNGEVILKFLEDHGMIIDFLGLSDLRAIKEKGITFYRKHFKGETIYSLKGVISVDRSRRLIPCLRERDDKVVLEWESLSNGYFSVTKFPRFKSVANVKIETT